MQVDGHTITRQPVHPGYDSPEDDFHLLVDGQIIGGTYHCPVSDSGKRIEAGRQYVSYGPAGYSFGHPTREDAERVQLAAIGVTDATVTAEAGPAPAPEPAPLPVTWEQALAEAEQRGVRHCSQPAQMAVFCEAAMHHTVGAVSPRLIWEGAMRQGMTLTNLGRLAVDDPIACSELMWT
ncbi:MAG: hypothetical protein HOY75_08100 [Streptomyces sp.]|nr:hypothetical protein [Streptomyces sp.]